MNVYWIALGLVDAFITVYFYGLVKANIISHLCEQRKLNRWPELYQWSVGATACCLLFAALWPYALFLRFLINSLGAVG